MAEQIDIQQSNKALIWTGVVVVVLLIALLTNGFGLFSGKNNVTGGAIIETPIPLAIENSPVLGKGEAPITVYIFSDFACPYCGAAAGQNLQVISQLTANNPGWTAPVSGLIENEVKEGKVKLVFKYFPGHGGGSAAHQVALALNEQGLFWKFHDLAFANQADTNSMQKMKELAEQLGADMTKLDEDLQNNNYQAQLQREYQMGSSNGVQGTPSFFINGQLVSGAQPYSTLKQLIDSQLN